MDTRRPHIDWILRSFLELSVAELYDLMRLRQQVFVVEQQCAYLDADGLDEGAWHLSGRTPSGQLVACLRVLPPDGTHDEASIGRVVVEPAFRGRGLGRALMLEGLRIAEMKYPDVGVRVSAQAHLEQFYGSLGFSRVGAEYLEDGIPHVEMRRGA